MSGRVLLLPVALNGGLGFGLFVSKQIPSALAPINSRTALVRFEAFPSTRRRLLPSSVPSCLSTSALSAVWAGFRPAMSASSACCSGGHGFRPWRQSPTRPRLTFIRCASLLSLPAMALAASIKKTNRFNCSKMYSVGVKSGRYPDGVQTRLNGLVLYCTFSRKS